MRLSVIAVGSMKAGPERELVERYRSRAEVMARGLKLSGLEMIELSESRSKREEDRRSEEAQKLLERAGSCALVVFDERGKSPSSEAFARLIEAWRDEGRQKTAFLIGGPDGLDGSVRDKADIVVSFGGLTLPHQIVRVLVAEQIYRAMTILAGHPYHRIGALA